MRIPIIPQLQMRAQAKSETALLRQYGFAPNIDLAKLFRECRSLSGSKAINLTDSLVFKQYALPLGDRLLGARLDPCRGLIGGYGEVLNMLVANHLGVAAPALLAAEVDLFRGTVMLVIERLQDCRSVAEMINLHNARDLTGEVFRLLHYTLIRGLYHGDTNASNIMGDSGSRRWYFIDFELALPLGCRPATGFALQAAAFWDWRVQSHLPREQYRALVSAYLREAMGCTSVADELALFDAYTLCRPGRLERVRRLKIACGGEVDIRPLLNTEVRKEECV